MIFHPFLGLLHLLMAGLLAGLPSWDIVIGSGAGDGNAAAPSTDHDIIHYGLQIIAGYDRFFPVHDGFLPIMAISGTLMIGLLGYKGVMLILNLVRGAGA